VGLFRVKQNVNKKFSQNDKKEVKYVWLSSRKAIFIITGDIKESKYSYGIPIIPLLGYYRSNSRSYTADELRNYYVVLNLPKDADISELEGKKVVIVGYGKDVLYIDENNDEKGEDEKGETK